METTATVPNLSYEIFYRQCIDAVEKYFPEVTRVTAFFMIDEAEQIHGESYIIGMAGFLAYAHCNEDMEEHQIKATLAHDLNGRKDPTMLPRTAEYTQFANTKLILN